MAEISSSHLLAIGASAPEFELPDPSGQMHTVDDVRGPGGLLLMFVCNHCPFVVHLAKALGEFARECEADGIGVVAINSNDVQNYPADAPPKMVEFAAKNDWTFPYLFDADQSVAHAFRAACTPDFYLFDGALRLVYAGQFDGSRPRNGKQVTGEDLRSAVRAMCDGHPPITPQLPSSGCNIKWIPGNENQ